MNEELLLAFLDDCKADPSDPTPFLILADWLDEHGETETDRTRVQAIRARYGPTPESLHPWEIHEAGLLRPFAAFQDESVTLMTGVFGELQAEIEDLLTPQYQAVLNSPDAAWLTSLFMLESDPRFGEMCRQPWLRHLTQLRLNSQRPAVPDWLRDLLSSPFLTRLSELHLASYNLDGEHLTDSEVAQLAAWPGLAQLRALTPHLHGPAALAELTASPYLGELRKLPLWVTDIGNPGLALLCRCPRLSRLKDLDVYACGIDDLSPLSGATFAHALPEITLWMNQVGDEGAGQLAAASLPALTKLHLAENTIGDTGASHLALAHWPALTELGLAHNRIGPEGATALGAATWLRRLETLSMYFNPLGPGPLTLLGAPLLRVRSLGLSRCGLGPASLTPLATSPHLCRLDDLLLSGNPIGPEGIRAVVACPSLTGLRSFRVERTELGGEGVRLLARWPGLARLTFLNLSNNNLDNDSIRELLASPFLGPDTYLNVRGNDLSPALTEEVKRHNDATPR
jgi:uncharacterized protein (TIGR02996 family)